MAETWLKLRFDLDTLAFGAAIGSAYSLRDLLARLPDGAEALLDWMPAITLDEAGFDFDPVLQRFELAATAGIASSAHPSASVFLKWLPGQPKGTFALDVGVRLDSPIDLSAAPVLGSLLDGIGLDDIAVTYSSQPRPPGDAAFAAGLSLQLTLRAGDAEETFTLRPRGRARVGAREASDAPPLVQWFQVQKRFGPLAVERIGIATPPGRLGLGLDASITIAALSLALTGFVATFAQDDISLRGLRIDLDGLALSFASGPVRIAGSLVRKDRGEFTEYAGGLIVQAGKFGITAVGALARVEGAISLFVFGLVEGPFGGPPAFFVTGLAAGFGYNRGLKLPAHDKVQEYPLILAAKNGSAYLPSPSPAAALGKLSEGGWVPPQLGSYWVAAGVKFSSFQVLDSFAVLAVVFGRELVIALLGIAGLKLPKVGPTYAYAELTLKAELRPLEGTFQMTALLTPNSFVIDRNCRLQGGFAFWIWFGEHEHSGDFVVTLGGYNPHYTAPLWYPQVPRLGFTWNVNSEVHLGGGAYFALTPSCVMAGGSLSLTFHSGELWAWFNAYADFLIFWKPFWFDIRIGIAVRARYTLSLGSISKTFSIDLSAQVELWGPPLAGKARVNWSVISFTININGGQRPAGDKVLRHWREFAESYLPPGPAEVCRPLAVAGLTQTIERPLPGGKETIWVVDAGALALGLETLIPATRLTIAGDSPSAAVVFEGPQSGVYPLGSVRLDARLTLRLEPEDAPDAMDLSRWTWSPAASNVPESMWGLENGGAPPMASNVQPALLSCTGVPHAPRPSGPPAFPLDRVQESDLPVRDLPLPVMPPIDGSTVRPLFDSRVVIRDTIAEPDVVMARDALVAVLDRIGIGTGLAGGDLVPIAREVWLTYPERPMLGPLGTTGPRDAAVAARTVTSRAPAKPRRRARKRADSAAAHVLCAIFGPAGSRVLDGFARREERQQAAALLGGEAGRSRVRMQAGTTLVWEVPEASRLMLSADGALALQVAFLDRQGVLLDDPLLAGAASIALPDRARRVAVTALGGVTAGAAGWSGEARLLLAAPQALLARGAVVRPQSPVRVARGRGSRPWGVVTGRAMLRGNRIGGEPGWIETTFSRPVRSVAVIVRGDDAGASRAATTVAMWHDTPPASPGWQALSPAGITRTFGRSYVVYGVPPHPAGTRRFLLRAADREADGMLGLSAAADDLQPGALFLPPSSPAAGVTEVTFR